MPTTTNTAKSTAPRWDLESIFPGGATSKEFADFRATLKKDLQAIQSSLKALAPALDDSSRSAWVKFVLEFQRLGLYIDQARSFAHCLISQNTGDEAGHGLVAEIDTYIAQWYNVRTALEARFYKQPDDEWTKFTAAPELKAIEFSLNEMREIARHKMPPEMESLALELAVNGYHAWSRLYDKVSGDITVEFGEGGKAEKLSIGQLANKLQHPNRETRKRAFKLFEQAWTEKANICAATLNSQAGFRWSLYKRRGWNSIMTEPLQLNRMKMESVEAMWHAVQQSLPEMKRYIDAKKKLIHSDKFCWFDQFAPVGHLDVEFNWQQAGDFVVKHLGSFSEEMAEFSRLAIDKRWVEAEDRPGKADGAYCTGMNLKGVSRIFMTYSDDYGSMSTLAHELGHGYHQWVLKDTPYLATEYPMGLAETASIFNELRVGDAALKEVSDPQGKILLIDQNLQNALILFCNIQARYLFDLSFYAEREKGVVSRGRLEELMLAAQKKAFGDILDANDGFHALFWASKLHFYITEIPFYNFPYTVGFLFAGGVYARALEEGKAFAPRYRALLEDTGRMTTEQVAQKHMGVDLTRDDFWKSGVARAMTHVDEFVRLASQAR